MKYLQVEDKFFIVKLNDQGSPVCVACTEKEAIDAEFEKITLSDPAPLDVSLFQEIIDRTKESMEKQLESSLKGLVLSALGFHRNDRDGFVVAGFNDKDSPVARHIAQKLSQKVLEVDLHKEFAMTPKEAGKLKIAMTAHFKKEYERHMQNLIYKAAREMAELHMRDSMKELVDDKLKVVARKLVEAAIARQNEPEWIKRLNG